MIVVGDFGWLLCGMLEFVDNVVDVVISIIMFKVCFDNVLCCFMFG